MTRFGPFADHRKPSVRRHRTRPWTLLMPLFVLCVGSCVAAPATVTEVLSLHYRDVNEIIPILRPLVPAPGVLTGLRGQLVVRTTPENLTEIKRILVDLDKTPRTLLITVRQGITELGDRSDIQGSVSSRTASIRAYSTHGARDDDRLYRLQVLEGREAFIRTGKSLAVPQTRTVVVSSGLVREYETNYREVESGVYVRPRLHGRDRIVLEISPRQAGVRGDHGLTTESHTASTTVSGQLGEWIYLGGVSRTERRSTSGLGYSTKEREDSHRNISVRVQLQPD